MIKSWDEHHLNMDFSNIGVVCSDIDLFHITKSGLLIIGEIKNHKGNFGKGQRHLLTQIIDNYTKGGAVLFITHTKDVHAGDTTVDISECLVDEYYWHGRWVTPSEFTTVNDAMEKLERWK